MLDKKTDLISAPHALVYFGIVIFFVYFKVCFFREIFMVQGAYKNMVYLILSNHWHQTTLAIHSLAVIIEGGRYKSENFNYSVVSN